MKKGKVDLNALRQTKGYRHPKKRRTYKSFKEQIEELRKQYPNDQTFGTEVAKLLRGIS